jgi:hypothetical protein
MELPFPKDASVLRTQVNPVNSLQPLMMLALDPAPRITMLLASVTVDW